MQKPLLKGKSISGSQEQSPSQLSQEQFVEVRMPIYPQFGATKTCQNNKKC